MTRIHAGNISLINRVEILRKINIPLQNLLFCGILFLSIIRFAFDCRRQSTYSGAAFLYTDLDYEKDKEKGKMETKLYVGNMSYDTTEDDLRQLLSEAGTVVTVDVIKDRDTGRPKGFAFVTMGSQAEAEKAIAMFNGKTVNNRALTVNIARPAKNAPAAVAATATAAAAGVVVMAAAAVDAIVIATAAAAAEPGATKNSN